MKKRISQTVKASLLFAAIIGAYYARKSGQSLVSALTMYSKLALMLGLNSLRSRVVQMQKRLAQ